MKEPLPLHLREALSLFASMGGRRRMELLSGAQRSALGRRAALVRHYGWCPHCETEPATAEHVAECEMAP